MMVLHGINNIPNNGDVIKNVLVVLYLSSPEKDCTEYSYDYHIEYNSGKLNILNGDYGNCKNETWGKYKKLFDKINLNNYKTEHEGYYIIPLDIFKENFDET